MRSILHQIESDQIKRKTTLFFGDRTQEDLYYYEELKSLEKTLADFTFVPTLSRPKNGDGWKGETGRVTDLIEKHIPDQAITDVYLCGAPAMVESCQTLLNRKGILEENIFFDKFE
jgi:NAD(P)H-flavin reductase